MTKKIIFCKKKKFFFNLSPESKIASSTSYLNLTPNDTIKKNEKEIPSIWNSSENLLEVAIGVLLGDASIQKNTSKTIEKWRLKFSQSNKHKEYLFHLHEMFSDYIKSPPFFDEKRNMYNFQTLFHKDFNFLAKLFIGNQGKKIVPHCFCEIPISPISIAYWFMDDGGSLSYNPRSGVVFNTQSFTFDEVEILKNNLNKHYEINCWIKTNKGRPVIAISSAESQHFFESFLPYIHKTLYYKLPLRLKEQLKRKEKL